MNGLRKALRILTHSRVLMISTLFFLSLGVFVGVAYFPPEWPVLIRVCLGLGAGLMATLYAVGNHLLMEMDDSVHAENEPEVKSSTLEPPVD